MGNVTVSGDASLSLSYNPSNQGLKLDGVIKAFDFAGVFILQSIKPRVETLSAATSMPQSLSSLSYNPSNQGLKLETYVKLTKQRGMSLSYNPSNQGLKHIIEVLY